MPKINQLNSKTVPSNNDEFPFHDPSSGTTRKITRGDLIGGAPLPANSVDTQALGDTGWINFVSTLPNIALNSLKYRKIGGVVYLHGQVQLVTGDTFPSGYTAIGTLPVGFRPPVGVATRVPIATYNSSLSAVRNTSAQIEADGLVSVYPEGTGAVGDVRFNVSYPAGS